MAEAVILVGLQGAGKTTYFQRHFAATHVHVSRDVLLTAGREAALIDEHLRQGRSFVVDNTNATRAVREGYVRAAKAAGFRVVAIYFDANVRTAIGRNNHRTDKKPIPVPAILRTAKKLQPAVVDEGFDEVRTAE